jgi:hypothetical protein
MEELHLGQDHGYSALKDSSGNCIASAITEGKKITASDEVIEVRIGDKFYTLSAQGKMFSGGANKLEKILDKEIIKVSTLASIYKASRADTVNCKLCVGLPIEYYTSQCDEFEKYIKNSCNGIKVSVDKGRTKTIFIKNITSIPQSAGMPFLLEERFSKNKNTVVIDFGYNTIDVSFYNGMNLRDIVASVPKGTKDIFRKCASKLNTSHNINLNETHMEDVFKKGTVKNSQGEIKDLSVLNDLVDKYIYDIVSKLMTEYADIGQADEVIVIGGGAIPFKKEIKKHIKNNTYFIDNARTANADSFLKVAKMCFK